MHEQNMPQPTEDKSPALQAEPGLYTVNDAPRPQPPLTEKQITKMDARRYPKFMSKEEIEAINAARARGIHYGV